MVEVIELNEQDIIHLIAESFGVKENDILLYSKEDWSGFGIVAAKIFEIKEEPIYQDYSANCDFNHNENCLKCIHYIKHYGCLLRDVL